MSSFLLRVLPGLIALLALAPLGAQNLPAPGFRLTGQIAGTDTHLIDVNGNIVHTWTSSFQPGVSTYPLADGTLMRTIKSGTITGTQGGVGGGVQKVAFDGTVLWDYRHDGPGYISHHDIAVLPNGNVLMLAWEDKTPAEAIAAGRDPAIMVGSVFRPDHVIEVQPTGPTSGTIVWQWHVWDHLVQDYDSNAANFGAVGNHPELVDLNFPATQQADDWNHMNAISYDPTTDLIMLSARGQHEIWVIDHGTTSTEAAGHSGGTRGRGGDLLFRWGNPQAYRAGTALDQMLFGQHGSHWIPQGLVGAGNILLYNNNVATGSEVWELVPPLDPQGNYVMNGGGSFDPSGPVWSYAPPLGSTITSNAQRLPNGNTLVCSGLAGALYEVDGSGSLLWNYTHPQGSAPTPLLFHAHYVERSLWASATTISGPSGGSVGFDLVAGSDHDGDLYWLLASISGTSPGVSANGHVLPLNWDDVLVFTLENGNTSLLSQSQGVLDAAGRATASFNLSGPAPVFLNGLQLHFAYGTLDPVTLSVTATSNAVPVQITP